MKFARGTSKARDNNVMHAKPDLRVFLKWMIAGTGSVITDVIPLIASMYRLLIAFLIFTGGCGSPESHQATSRTPGGWLQTDVAGRALVYRHENGEDRSQYSPDENCSSQLCCMTHLPACR